MFSSLGLVIACKVSSLNRFILATVPAEIVVVVPAVIWLFWDAGRIALLHPGVAGLAFLTREGGAAAFFILLVWTAVFVLAAVRSAKRMLRSLGGVKL
jgi:fluoroquinolone transport system permease protein